jgi:pimeloyl-ACP methyl ester carboxylesterase
MGADFERPGWVPETRYARNGDVHLAYQVFGSGEVTLVGLPGIVSNVDLQWDDPETRAWLLALARRFRVIVFDKRGQGVSERAVAVPTLDERLADLTAVLDAAGAGRVALGGVSEGGSTAALYAATHPERVSHLVMIGSFARPGPKGDAGMRSWASAWGTPQTLSVALLAPQHEGDAVFLRWANRFERACATPAGLLAAWAWVQQVDVRAVLPSIRCPALVLHHAGDRLVPVAFGRELAEGLPDARFVELDGAAHNPQWGQAERTVELITEFIAGDATPPRTAERVLATVLLTDIAGSTRRAAELGDAAWRSLLDRHDTVCADTVSRFEGRLIKSTGDGVLATFDAPGRALGCADALRTRLGGAGIEIRAGVHTGEIELRGEDVGGIAVHIAARVEATAQPGEVLASRTVRDLTAGSSFAFASTGLHELKGVPEPWELFAVATA